MKVTKGNRAKLQIIISTLVLTMIIIEELYLMTNYFLNSHVSIIVLAVVALVAVYVLANAIITISDERELQRQMHFEKIYKSEKTMYLMLKNKFDEIEQRLVIIEQISKIPEEEIINAQKGIAKIIINRSKENADAIINSNDQVLERLDEIEEVQNTKFTGISKDMRLDLTEMSNQTERKLRDMLVQLKDMEIRLNQTMNLGAEFNVKAVAPETDMIAEQTRIPEESDIEEPTEEVPPMQDLSEPNRTLSPDEIAALIADMSKVDTF